MEKIRLYIARMKKGMSQEDMAVLANMDQSTYGRKEKGISKITSREWKKFVSILEIPLNEIFEDDNSISSANSLNYKVMGNSNDFCNVPEFILERLNNYIKKLEHEVNTKEEEIIFLKSEITKLNNKS